MARDGVGDGFRRAGWSFAGVELDSGAATMGVAGGRFGGIGGMRR